ncbi:hypothetical protein LF817_10850 [Halobacillus sp. A1]|uniref:hypothetical protein n=1 Tax=Halobacillus sp. A1 TaxID=2880262 RepID=UPI0020A63C60|nr:hypothetical protein [Halobacillus sp. A1]MCP3031842.1 hypothetical protein [Halobacillus sp. A1]
MNELMDRRLKKMNHNVKYQQVPMDEYEMDKLLNQATNQAPKNSKVWKKSALPMPAAAVLIFMIFQVQPSHSSQYDTTSLSQRPVHTEMKGQQLIENDEAQHTIEQASAQSEQQTYTMVRHTYIIFNDEMFVQTGETIEKSKLVETIGTVKPETSAELQRRQSITSKENIYSVEGMDENEVIAIKSRRSTGHETTKKDYYIFQKQDSLPIAQ